VTDYLLALKEERGTAAIASTHFSGNTSGLKMTVEPVDLGWRGDPADILCAADVAPADALRRWLDAQPGWRRHAACVGTDPSVFFPVRGESTADALHVCGRCLVLTDCRDWALDDPSLDYGVLGGMSARARKAARRARRTRPSAQ